MKKKENKASKKPTNPGSALHFDFLLWSSKHSLVCHLVGSPVRKRHLGPDIEPYPNCKLAVPTLPSPLISVSTTEKPASQQLLNLEGKAQKLCPVYDHPGLGLCRPPRHRQGSQLTCLNWRKPQLLYLLVMKDRLEEAPNQPEITQ